MLKSRNRFERGSRSRSHFKGDGRRSVVETAVGGLLSLENIVLRRHRLPRPLRTLSPARGIRSRPAEVEGEEADEGGAEAEADHAVDDEVDAGVEDEAEDVEAGQDPDGDWRMKPTSRLAIVEMAASNCGRMNNGVDLK